MPVLSKNKDDSRRYTLAFDRNRRIMDVSRVFQIFFGDVTREIQYCCNNDASVLVDIVNVCNRLDVVYTRSP